MAAVALPRGGARCRDGIGFATQSVVGLFTGLRSAVVAAAALLLVYAMVADARQDLATPLPSEPRVLTVVARRFAFEPSRIEVRQGEQVRLLVRSADGVHGVRIRGLRVNTLVPRDGSPVTLDFVADTPGTYEIRCSEYCGTGHDSMRGALVVHAAPD